MEPQLRNPPPRVLRIRWQSRIGPQLLFWLGIGMLALFAGIGYFAQKKHTALRDHGVGITAHLAEKEPRHGKTGPYLIYKYELDGKTYTYTDSASSDEFENTPLGAPLELMYLPESPGSASLTSEVAGEYSSGLVVSAIMAPMMSLILFGAWYYIHRTYKRKELLARDGLPTPTAAHEILLNKSYPKYDQYKIRYEYDVQGVHYESSTTVNGVAMQALALPESRATVLYDPLDPAHSDLYPSITQIYTFETLG